MPADNVMKLAVAADGVPYDHRMRPELEPNIEVILDNFLGDHWSVGAADKMRPDWAVRSATNMLFSTMLAPQAFIRPSSDENIDKEIAVASEYSLTKAMSHNRKRRHDLMASIYGYQPFKYGHLVLPEIPNVGRKPIVVNTFRPIRPASIWQWFRDDEGVWVQVEQRDKHDVSMMHDIADMQIMTYDEEWGQITGRALYRDLHPIYRNKLKLLIYSHARRGS